jgi:hypothetical protein
MASQRSRRRCLEQRLEGILHKQHGHHDDVAVFDRIPAALEGAGIRAPFIGAVDFERESWKIVRQAAPGAQGCAGQMAVHGHDDEADDASVSG